MWSGPSGRKGFTLIELLVVIAIISILASILFPVFSRARAKARQTACLSNQNQLDKAIIMYQQDYDESFPYARLPGFAGHYSATEWQWYDAIHEYTRNWEIDVCPEIKVADPGYGMNAALSGTSVGIMYDAAKKIVIIDFSDPSQPVNTRGQCQVNGDPNYPGILDPLLNNNFAQRHNGGYNISYGDGHSKFALPSGIDGPVYWDPAYRS
jgi:prepilin-type N-terminal cleavage/methylation domain-containing protein/prepilin-type processing-associated H-X9-DG protein